MLSSGKAYFYPRSPCGERQAADISARREARISIHALLAESDRVYVSYNMYNNTFLSTLSLRRATHTCKSVLCWAASYFYPRSPCGERLPRYQKIALAQSISIHALLAESDVQPDRGRPAQPGISIHALLAESDTIFAVRPYDAPIFLSTLSLRRATRKL